MPDRPPDTIRALIAEALRETGRLAGRTLDLARTEIDGNVRALIGLAAVLGTIVVLLVAAFFVFLDALVKALAVLIGSDLVAAALVAGPFVAVAGVLVGLGVRGIARATRAAPAERRGRAAGTALTAGS